MKDAMTAPARRELVEALRQRYAAATREEKVRILTEFAAVSGLHRKSAIRVLNAESELVPAKRRGRPCVYDQAVQQGLATLWEASDRVCGKRLRPLLRSVSTVEEWPSESEGSEGAGEHVELVVAGGDAAEALYAAEESLDMIALSVKRLVELPGFSTQRVGRNDRLEAEQAGEAARLVAFVGDVHGQGASMLRASQSPDQLAPLGSVAALAGREAEADGMGIIRGNQMNRGVPAPLGFTDRLRPVFFSALVPSGWTFALVLSNETTFSSRCSSPSF